MYALTLTADERRALDWIGDRYSHGNDLADLIDVGRDEDADWSGPDDFTFNMPEHRAWEVAELINGSQLDCFAPALVEKLRSFADSIV